MKKTLIMLLLLFIFGSCNIPYNDPKKEILIKEVEKYTGTQIIDTKIYPKQISFTEKANNIFTNRGSLFAGMGNGYIDVSQAKVNADFNNGIFYWENSYNVTNNTNIIDLSSSIGSNVCEVLLYIKWVDYGRCENISNRNNGKDSGPIQLSFDSPGLSFEEKQISQNYNDIYQAVWVMTNNLGQITWKQLTTSPYDAVTEYANPGVHIYQWKQCEIWVFAKRDISIMDINIK